MKRVISIALVLVAILAMTMSASADTNTIYSDTSVMVYGPLTEYKPLDDAAWGVAKPAVPAWNPGWPALPGATWISDAWKVSDTGDSWRWFTKTVDLCPHAYDISGSVTVTSDNAEETYVNGVLKGTDGEVQGSFHDDQEWKTFITYPFSAADGDTTLTFDFIVRNYGVGGTPDQNPTGLIFSATYTYSCAVEVTIDIKPGSFPSCFNNNGTGIIPVAIFGSETFDVHDVVLSSLHLDVLSLAMRGHGKYMAAFENVNKDSYVDLVLKFNDVDGTFDREDEFATLTGSLEDGTHFYGVGDICIRP